MGKHNLVIKFLTAGVAALIMTACGSPQMEASTEQPLPQVKVASVIHERVTEWDEFTGRLQAPETVTLVPRVSGYIQRRHFVEGALVSKGDLLLEIDAAPFAAEVARISAELESAQSASKLAQNEYQRAESLRAQRAVSDEILETRLAQKQQAQARVAATQAALQRAELDLSYTRIKAPMDGRISYAQVTAGNYVTAGQTLLTSLVSTQKMHAYFDIDEHSYLKYAQLASQGKRADTRSEQQHSNPVFMALMTDTDYHHLGRIDFVDNRVNQQTGTIRLRAVFENDDDLLLPGLFARIKLAGSASREAILIDDKAIGTDLSNKFVFVLNGDNELEYRRVTLGNKVGGLRIIDEGLEAGDAIVVNGLQRVQPNMMVQPDWNEMATEQQLDGLRMTQELLDTGSRRLTARIEYDNAYSADR
ncbi:efflux transporter periplasmic adaptor subunit [Aliidiomarina minuta]|uniref:Efflux transporter periplasmic adaptor subunit n=1 Tax=Aliidiomarina minuta TaxID=880057 RepID=A0A432W1D3_9GAMM|nr:efflux RND transporter periplasmic adaptor subunit [Aliidiomarina minuta]RUO23007.1 efflux transporter periplasmic adaptor subunit [Aliidiomarina minuta]